MGKNGSTWRHDWIPTNMAAARLKAHGSKPGAARALGKPLRTMNDAQLMHHYDRPDVGNSGHAVKAVLSEMQRREDNTKRAAAKRQARRAANDAHRNYLEGHFVGAENATRGNLVNKRGRAAGIDGRTLLTGSSARRNAYASDELKSYMDRNPVLSASEFSAYQRGDTHAAARNAKARTALRTFGVY